MLLLLQLSCLVSLSLARHSGFSRLSRQGKNSRLLTWGLPAKGPAAPISLFGRFGERGRSGGGGRWDQKHAAILRSIELTNKEEEARENDRLLEREESGEQEDWKWRDKEEIERRAKKKKEEKKSREKNGGGSAFSEKDRSGKEGEDLLKPPYNSDFDLGGKVRLLDGVDSAMGLQDELTGALRQAGGVSEEETLSANAVDREEDKDVRCIKKVMQVEETVWERRIRCEHRFTKKCHDTYITDYVPTQEEKCETSFKKNCRITYKPVMFTEEIQICSEPLEKFCSNTTVGEEVCRTHYQTSCETRLKEHEVEQDEPVCKMVTERKCKEIQAPVDGGSDDIGASLQSLGQECEDWPVQRCTLEKKTVKKVSPDTSCRKIPREICAPSNCEIRPAEKVCRDEQQDLIQNIPTEDCNLEPQEDCRMETVLVPRLVLKPNCIKVPKEICVEAKVNPRKVKKPVIREWCYKPSDLRSPSSRATLSQMLSKVS